MQKKCFIIYRENCRWFMSIQPIYKNNINFRDNLGAYNAPLMRPTEAVQNTVQNSVDTFINKVEEEKNKESNKKALAVATSVTLLSGLVLLLNPKISGKLINKFRIYQHSMSQKINKNKDNVVKSKFYKTCSKAFNGLVRVLEFSNNFNSAKDIVFKKICTENLQFSKVKNNGMRTFLTKMSSFFTKIFKKPYQAITKGFDKISQHTVFRNYKKAEKRMNSFESIVEDYAEKLSPDEKTKVLTKLKEAQGLKEVFTREKVAERFLEQEKTMSNLENDLVDKFKKYVKSIKENKGERSAYIKDNLSFWAQDIMQPSRENFEKQGIKSVQNLVGNTKEKVGVYTDIIEILKPNLNTNERALLEKSFKKASKSLTKANKSECLDYFDKKRDLVVGSAPTDIVSAGAMIGLGGLAIGVANSKEDKISKTITVGAPAVLGVGTSIALTAMLFSGIKGMLRGGGTGLVISKIGSIIDHKVLGNTKEKNPKASDLQMA